MSISMEKPARVRAAHSPTEVTLSRHSQPCGRRSFPLSKAQVYPRRTHRNNLSSPFPPSAPLTPTNNSSLPSLSYSSHLASLLLFLLCLPVWVSAPPSLLGLTSQLDCVAQWSPVSVSATRLILPFLSESPARYSNKELKGMLVWSPNHCVSDAKREWGGPRSGSGSGSGSVLGAGF